MMEDWERDFEWLRIRHYVKDIMGLQAVPDFQGMLFLIGIQELGKWGEEFTKEEKQDLMHIATCRLLEPGGFFEFQGRDHDGWPHYRKIQPFTITGHDQQETYLIERIVEYFDLIEKETPTKKVSHNE